MPFLGGTRRLAHHDFDVSAQSVQAIDHLALADASKLAAQQAGQLGLSHAQKFSGLRLRQVPMLDDHADFRSQSRLHLHFVGIGDAKILVDVAGSFFHYQIPS